MARQRPPRLTLSTASGTVRPSEPVRDVYEDECPRPGLREFKLVTEAGDAIMRCEWVAERMPDDWTDRLFALLDEVDPIAGCRGRIALVRA